MVQKAVSTRRDGMVLLIVLALLAMVGLTAITFLLTTGQLKDASEQNRRMGEVTIDPDVMLQDAVMQVIRGTDNTNSAVAGHSLLEDMYGNESATASKFTGTVNETLVDGMAVISATGGNSNYVGRVVTCIDEESPSCGKSTVIIKYQDSKYYCLPFPDGKGFESGANGGSQFLVNDMPFQGIREYDAVDENNEFLTRRETQDTNDGNAGRILSTNYSFRNATNKYGTVDADNDGYEDSYWLDLGMPVFSATDGTRFKPLFGIVVEDMDGRLNVNAHGDLYNRLGKSYGMGRGPGEIGLRVLEDGSNGFSCSVENLIRGRFSANYSSQNPNSTGGTPDHFATATHKGAWYAAYEGTITNTGVQRTPYDIRGILKPSVSGGGEASWEQLSSTGTATTVTADTGMKQVGTEATASLNPYDLDLGLNHLAGIYSNSSPSSTKPGTGRDMPYSPSELEALLRPYDFDSPFLPERLRYRLGAANPSSWNAQQKVRSRTLITTESWDIPVIPETPSFEGSAGDMLPEILAGFPLDLLRSATFNDTNDPIQSNGQFKKREDFAKCIYRILETLGANMGDGDENRSRNNAQWAINVVDFLDADSIMTPFNYDGDSWVYGCERPELLMVETLALHSKNTEYDVLDGDSGQRVGGKNGDRRNKRDTDIYETDSRDGDNLPDELEANKVAEAERKLEKLNDNNFGPDEKADFDQLIRPQGSLFVEIYNPWTKNDQFPTLSQDLYVNGGREVELTKVAGNSSVWRLVVMNSGTQEEWDSNARDETDAGWNEGSVERVIDFAPSTTPTDGTVKYHAKAGSAVNLAGGQYVLVGPEGTTVLSYDDPNREAVESITTANIQREINMDTKKLDGATYQYEVLSIANADGDVRMSLTEDTSQNYPTGYDKQTMQLDKPLDRPLDYQRSEWNSLFRMNKKHEKYRIIHLQRLANPNRGHDANTNPYVTVDSMVVDLTVYNARTSLNDSDENESGSVSEIATCQRGKDASETNIWKQKYSDTVATTGGKTGSGAFSGTLKQNFGAGVTDSASIPWLGWINRPPVSPFELMNVTFRNSATLLRELNFESDDSTGIEQYGYLPNFSTTANKKFFGYVRIPSPQTVTPMVLNKSNSTTGANAGTTGTDTLPFAYYSMYREPGRININTIYDETVLAALLNRERSDSSISTIFNKLPGSSTGGSTSGAQKAFRSIAEVPGESILRDFSTFKRTADAGGGSTGSSSEFHPFYRLEDYYRLANLTTTRSNVFAVWVTMGFFEVDGNDNPISGNSQTGSGSTRYRELGEAFGNVKRYRSFYLIDRSIPVGFERGKNHNAENVILLKRMLQ
ncbi:MAG: hypothetical protein Q4C70_05410 [Planctomycetia bacterium]|nr:hypothetical protein [Planctomycetia bacterium]